MQIRVPTTRLKDIGPLDKVMRLPIMARRERGMKTTCSHCGKQVEEDYFIAGFKTGMANMILHEKCWDGSGEKIGEGWEPTEI